MMIDNLISSHKDIFDWATKQSYIALGNLMTTASRLKLGTFSNSASTLFITCIWKQKTHIYYNNIPIDEDEGIYIYFGLSTSSWSND